MQDSIVDGWTRVAEEKQHCDVHWIWMCPDSGCIVDIKSGYENLHKPKGVPIIEIKRSRVGTDLPLETKRGDDACSPHVMRHHVGEGWS